MADSITNAEQAMVVIIMIPLNSRFLQVTSAIGFFLPEPAMAAPGIFIATASWWPAFLWTQPPATLVRTLWRSSGPLVRGLLMGSPLERLTRLSWGREKILAAPSLNPPFSTMH